MAPVETKIQSLTPNDSAAPGNSFLGENAAFTTEPIDAVQREIGDLASGRTGGTAGPQINSVENPISAINEELQEAASGKDGGRRKPQISLIGTASEITRPGIPNSGYLEQKASQGATYTTHINERGVDVIVKDSVD